MFRHPSSYLQFSPGFAFCLGPVYMVFSRSSSPISNSVNALEIWLLVCLMMIFLFLIEFLITLKYRAQCKNKQQLTQSSNRSTADHNQVIMSSSGQSKTNIHEHFETIKQVRISQSLFQKCETKHHLIFQLESSNSLIVNHSKQNESKPLQQPKNSSFSIPSSNYVIRDIHSKFLSPLIFTSFIFIYWIYFVYLAK